VRGFVGRRRAIALLLATRSKRSAAQAALVQAETARTETLQVARHRTVSVIALQCCARRWAARRRAAAAASAARRRHTAAALLQRMWRRAQKRAQRAQQAQLATWRHVTPYATVQSPRTVVVAALAASLQQYSCSNPFSGGTLWRLCRALGCDSDALPLLRAAGIGTVSELALRTDKDLQAAGLKELQGGGRGKAAVPLSGVRGAAALRRALLLLAAPAPAAVTATTVTSPAVAQLLADCTALQDHPLAALGYPTKAGAVRSAFRAAYGDGYASREEVVVAGLRGADVTGAQLKRFFLLHETPGKAKEALGELQQELQVEADVASHWDERRVTTALWHVTLAADRLRGLLRLPQRELASSGSSSSASTQQQQPAAQLIAQLTELVHAAAKLPHTHKVHTAARGTTTSTAAAAMQAQIALLTAAQQLLVRLAAGSTAATGVQKALRRKRAARAAAAAAHVAALTRHTAAYMWEVTHDHVRAEWTAARAAEAAAAAVAAEEARHRAERARREAAIAAAGALRFGWQYEFADSDEVASDVSGDVSPTNLGTVYRQYKRVRRRRTSTEAVPVAAAASNSSASGGVGKGSRAGAAASGFVVESVLMGEADAKPLYSYEEDVAASCIGK
jgi:hypothetical protein